MSCINLIIPFSLVESKYMSLRLHVNDLWPLGEYILTVYLRFSIFARGLKNNFSP